MFCLGVRKGLTLVIRQWSPESAKKRQRVCSWTWMSSSSAIVCRDLLRFSAAKVASARRRRLFSGDKQEGLPVWIWLGLPDRAQIENNVPRGRLTFAAMRLNGYKAIVRKDLILDLRERVICLFKAIGASATGASAVRASAIGSWAISALVGSDIVVCRTCSQVVLQENTLVNIRSFISILFISRSKYTVTIPVGSVITRSR